MAGVHCIAHRLVLWCFLWSPTAAHRAAHRYGSVAEVYAGEAMLVASEHTRLPVRLAEATSYEGNASAIQPGARVTVLYGLSASVVQWPTKCAFTATWRPCVSWNLMVQL